MQTETQQNSEIQNNLVQQAMAAREWAYAPYSNYRVGAALLAESGRVYTGVNVENAAYPTGICAERVAVYKAISEGERSFRAVAVVSANGGTPCGSCRQVLAEFGLATRVIVADERGNVTLDTDVASLLPGAFLPEHLKI